MFHFPVSPKSIQRASERVLDAARKVRVAQAAYLARRELIDPLGERNEEDGSVNELDDRGELVAVHTAETEGAALNDALNELTAADRELEQLELRIGRAAVLAQPRRVAR